MKISRNWLAEYVDFSEVDTDTYLDHINTRIAEIEDSYTVGAAIEHAVIVEVRSVLPHPTSATLHIAHIYDGNSQHEVVCGASNVRVGMLTAYVPPGGLVRKHNVSAEVEELVTVEVRSVHGVNSRGILCSESELGISSDHSGIIDITDELLGTTPRAGIKLSEVLEGTDFIIDIDNKSLTHRPDLWSHLGFAREIAAIYGKDLKQDYDKQISIDRPVAEEFIDTRPGDFSAEIICTDTCSRFSILELSNVSNSNSPYWLKKRLFITGNNTKSLLVDVSNYVLNDVGQPNHAFDKKTLRGKTLYARYAEIGESFLALDEQKRDFTQDDIVIADEVGPLDLAGVIGGKDFSVSEHTTDIVLVCSTLDATAVRKASKRHQIRTDSSSRYEKSLSSVQTTLAMLSFVRLLRRLGQTPIIKGFSDAPQRALPSKTFVPYNFGDMQNRLQDALVDEHEARKILERLQFKFHGDCVEVPYYRATKDISISADLIEELGRSIGYARVPECAPLIQSNGTIRNNILHAENQISTFFAANGFNEVYNYTFSSADIVQRLGYDTSDIIELQNSVDQSLSSLRTTLIPGLIKNVNDNLRFYEKFSLFEVGRSYHKTASTVSDEYPPLERRMLAAAIVSSTSSPRVVHPVTGDVSLQAGQTAFYALTSLIKKLCASFHTKEVSFIRCKTIDDQLISSADYAHTKRWMHPYRSASISIGGLVCGHVAELRSSLIKQKNTKVTLFELDISALLAMQSDSIQFSQLPKFPSSFFELSILTNKKDEYADVCNKIRTSLGVQPLLSRLDLLSVYEGASIPADKKSISIKFVFHREDSTIDTATLEGLREEVMKAVSDTGYSIRS